MSQEILEHLPKWRRLIRAMAIEAGHRKFVNSSDSHDNESLDLASDADDAQKPTQNKTKIDPRQESGS